MLFVRQTLITIAHSSSCPLINLRIYGFKGSAMFSMPWVFDKDVFSWLINIAQISVWRFSYVLSRMECCENSIGVCAKNRDSIINAEQKVTSVWRKMLSQQYISVSRFIALFTIGSISQNNFKDSNRNHCFFF